MSKMTVLDAVLTYLINFECFGSPLKHNIKVPQLLCVIKIWHLNGIDILSGKYGASFICMLITRRPKLFELFDMLYTQ